MSSRRSSLQPAQAPHAITSAGASGAVPTHATMQLVSTGEAAGAETPGFHVSAEEEAAEAAMHMWPTDAQRVRIMARGYRVHGAPVSELCRHNATVAASAGDIQLAHAWQALHYVLHAADADDDDAARATATGEPAANEGIASAVAAAAPAREGADGLYADCAAPDLAGLRMTLIQSVLPVIDSLLQHHAERGDAQTCVAVARTLSPIAPELASRQLMRRWTLGYVELLRKLQLFTHANEAIKQCEDEHIQQLNQRSTTVNVGGGGASASQNRPARARCSVCQLPVRGLYVWCQGCGHGGHAHHLQRWFEQSTECPAGCGHVCQLRPLEARHCQPSSADEFGLSAAAQL